MVEYCVCSDAIFGYHGRVDLYKANSLSLATGTAAIRLRTFRSRVPIPSRDCGDAPGVSSQPYLTMPSSPHAFKFDSPVNTPLLCFSPLTQCTTSPNLVLAVTTIPTIQSSSCHVTSHMGQFIPGHHPLLYSLLSHLLANSHDRLYMSYHRLINRIGHMKEKLRPA